MATLTSFPLGLGVAIPGAPGLAAAALGRDLRQLLTLSEAIRLGRLIGEVIRVQGALDQRRLAQQALALVEAERQDERSDSLTVEAQSIDRLAQHYRLLEQVIAGLTRLRPVPWQAMPSVSATAHSASGSTATATTMAPPWPLAATQVRVSAGTISGSGSMPGPEPTRPAPAQTREGLSRSSVSVVSVTLYQPQRVLLPAATRVTAIGGTFASPVGILDPAAGVGAEGVPTRLSPLTSVPGEMGALPGLTAPGSPPELAVQGTALSAPPGGADVVTPAAPDVDESPPSPSASPPAASGAAKAGAATAGAIVALRVGHDVFRRLPPQHRQTIGRTVSEHGVDAAGKAAKALATGEDDKARASGVGAAAGELTFKVFGSLLGKKLGVKAKTLKKFESAGGVVGDILGGTAGEAVHDWVAGEGDPAATKPALPTKKGERSRSESITVQQPPMRPGGSVLSPSTREAGPSVLGAAMPQHKIVTPPSPLLLPATGVISDRNAMPLRPGSALVPDDLEHGAHLPDVAGQLGVQPSPSQDLAERGDQIHVFPRGHSESTGETGSSQEGAPAPTSVVVGRTVSALASGAAPPSSLTGGSPVQHHATSAAEDTQPTLMPMAWAPPRSLFGVRQLSWLGKANLAVSTLAAGAQVLDVATGKGTVADKSAGLGQAFGGVAGGIAGAQLGAVLGSVVPGPGTLIGAALGSVLGSLGGEKLGQGIGKVVAWLAGTKRPEVSSSQAERGAAAPGATPTAHAPPQLSGQTTTASPAAGVGKLDRGSSKTSRPAVEPPAPLTDGPTGVTPAVAMPASNTLNQHFNLTANVPVTFNNSLDDPMTRQQLEAAVRRAFDDLLRQAAAVQHADPVFT